MFACLIFIIKGDTTLEWDTKCSEKSFRSTTHSRGTELQLHLEYTKFKCKLGEKKSKSYTQNAYTLQVSFLASLLYKRSHPAFMISNFFKKVLSTTYQLYSD